MREELLKLISQVQDCGADVTDVVKMIWVENQTLADHLIANGVVIPTRCEKCFYFIPMDDVRECLLYKDYPIDTAADMGFDGLCGNWDRWTSVDEFCSGGTEEVADD